MITATQPGPSSQPCAGDNGNREEKPERYDERFLENEGQKQRYRGEGHREEVARQSLRLGWHGAGSLHLETRESQTGRNSYTRA